MANVNGTLIGGPTYLLYHLKMIKLCSFTLFLSHFFMLLLWIIEENAPLGWRFGSFLRPKGGSFELMFCPGGVEFAHLKRLNGGFAPGGGGVVRLGID